MSAPSRPGPSTRLLAALLAVSLPLGALPAPAAAAGPQPALWALAAPTGKLTADAAASARKPTQTKAEGLLEASPDEAAELLAGEAAKKADPVLHIDAAEAYKVAGAKNKSRVDLENGIEQARIGLDILYFLQDPRADPEWQPVEPDKVASEISRGEKAIEGCEQAIEDLSKKDEPAPVVEDKQRKKAPRDGRGLIAAGSVFTVVGVAGLAMIGGGVGMGVSAQNHVEGLNPSDPDYEEQKAKDDDKGALGNTLVYAGIPVAVVGLAAGIALLVVGVKKRKKYRAEHGGDDDDNTARVQVLPMMGRGVGGLSLTGRF